MTRPKDAERLMRNDESRNHAEHHREPWTEDELEVLMSWDRSELHLAELAERLGRTMEACRQRFYETTWGIGLSDGTRRMGQRSAARPTQVHWVDDDEWPDWYIRG